MARRETLLPQYSAVVPAPQQPANLNRRRTDHTFSLTTNKNQPWVTLVVFSAAKSPKHVPVIHQGDDVEGSLSLNMEKAESIQSIHVSVTGKIMTGAGIGDTYTFLESSVLLWSKSDSEKLSGEHIWPYHVALPKTVRLVDQPAIFRLPETFSERHTRVSIKYELVAHISRGKWHTDSYLRTDFAYVPQTQPKPPSALRQLAYQENYPVVGPEGDPEGWKVLDYVLLHGSLFGSRQVEIKCTLSLAKPLCYTRGSVIPCILDLRSRDPQALDLLSKHTCPVVQLQRKVGYSTASPSSNKQDKMTEEAVNLHTAVFLPAETHGADGLTRRLNGEIHLQNNLKPTSAMANFSIKYFITFRGLESPGFVASTSETLLTELVEIATMHSTGPRTRAFCPPAYDSPESPPMPEFRAEHTGMALFIN